jgi:hypothetical protein
VAAEAKSHATFAAAACRAAFGEQDARADRLRDRAKTLKSTLKTAGRRESLLADHNCFAEEVSDDPKKSAGLAIYGA